jgi:hypothetical protein
MMICHQLDVFVIDDGKVLLKYNEKNSTSNYKKRKNIFNFLEESKGFSYAIKHRNRITCYKYQL